MDIPIHPDHQAVLDRFPPALRALAGSELALGNRIIHAGAGHPAPPAGAQIMFAQDLLTRDRELLNGLHCYDRNASTHHQEVSDADRFFWILTVPLPPPPEPDMDAIRDRANLATEQPPAVMRVYTCNEVELDYRGEMLILHEQDRRTDIVWTWNRGNQLYRSSLSPWWYPDERRSQEMTEAEKEAVIQRFLEFARRNISPNIELRD
ncbi:MAG: hypothetical protein KDB93_00805 [Flavobacteriales bacterium]|nr:hypothetical protein [Flavobacteriales bacterium]